MSHKSILPKTAFAEMKKDNTFLFDVREQRELGNGYVKGAKHVPLSLGGNALIGEFNKLPKGSKAIIMCHTGNRSSMVVSQLKKFVPSVELINLDGGIHLWHKEGLPIEVKR